MATYNWLVTCGCGSPTEYSCNTCGEKLCANCKQTHQQNDDTKHHSITEYAKKLMPGSLSSPSCHEHNGKECICWCQTCGTAACIDCVTTSHHDHRFTKLETVLQDKRECLQKELDNLESNELKEWQDLMKEATKVTSDFLGQVDGIEKELEERAKEFHKRVEEILEKYKNQLNQIKTSNLSILYKQEKEISDGLEKVKQEIKECEDRLRSSDIRSLLEHKGANNDKRDTLPTISWAISPHILTASQIDTKSLAEMFGRLTVPKPNRRAEGSQFSVETSHITQKSSNTESGKKLTEPATTQSSTVGPDEPVKASPRDTQTCDATTPTKPPTQLTPKPSVHSKFRTKALSLSVTCVGPGLAWVQTEERKIELVDRNGLVRDTIHTDFDFADTVLSPNGDILMCDVNNKCIKAISVEKKVKKLCKLKWEPKGLCYLHSGDIAVTFYTEGRVIIYSMSGKVIKELNKKLFNTPYTVAQSKVNSDLYISDNGAGKVLALDKDYKVRYEYTGQGERYFWPRGLCTDAAGHVLIINFSNQRVDILDEDGRFLQYLLTEEHALGMGGVGTVDTDSEGNAWVGEYYGGVKVVKYLQ